MAFWCLRVVDTSTGSEANSTVVGEVKYCQFERKESRNTSDQLSHIADRQGEEDEEYSQPDGRPDQTAGPASIVDPLDVCLQTEISQDSARGVVAELGVGRRHQTPAGLGQYFLTYFHADS